MILALPDIKYFECHITFEPVFDEQLTVVEFVVSKHRFKLAKLLMQKERLEKPQRSNKDTFCTSYSANYEELFERMKLTTADLEVAGFKVWRSKIEAIVYDERTK